MFDLPDISEFWLLLIRQIQKIRKEIMIARSFDSSTITSTILEYEIGTVAINTLLI